MGMVYGKEQLHGVLLLRLRCQYCALYRCVTFLANILILDVSRSLAFPLLQSDPLV
jgi:hypothetical protein